MTNSLREALCRLRAEVSICELLTEKMANAGLHSRANSRQLEANRLQEIVELLEGEQ